MALRKVIQVAPSNRLDRAQTVEDLKVELKEQQVKLNEALRLICRLIDEATAP